MISSSIASKHKNWILTTVGIATCFVVLTYGSSLGWSALLGIVSALAFIVFVKILDENKSLIRSWGTNRALHQTLNSAPHAICISNFDGRFTFQNSIFKDQLTNGPDTVLKDLFAGQPHQLKRMCELANTNQIATDLIVSYGQNYRAFATKLPKAGGLLWQFYEFDDVATPTGQEASVPMARLNPDGEIAQVNGVFEAVFGRLVTSTKMLTDGGELKINTHNSLRTRDGHEDYLIIQDGSLETKADLYFFGDLDAGTKTRFNVDIFYNLPVAMLKLSIDGKIIACNRAATLLLGPHLSSMQNINSVFSAGQRSANSWLQEALERPPLTRWDFLQLKQDDQDVILQVALTKAESQNEPFVFAALTDVTELKSLEAQFVQSQKMQAIGQLAGGVAHDFNNLLTAISGHCDLLLLKHDENDPDHSDLMQIHLNANRAASLVGQLLAFSRKQTLSLETIDLRESLAELTHLLNRLVGEKVKLEVMHHRDLKSIRADKRQLEQVIMNLVVNARDAMPNGGTVRVETDVKTHNRAIEREGAIIPIGDYVTIKISDEGVGIRPDDLSKIFNPFWSTKGQGEGTGLGLSTAYGIVKQSGGFLFVQSELGIGSTFEVILPVATPEQIPEPEPEAPPKIAPQKSGEGTVLLVEDEAPVRAFAARALRMKGYQVVEVDCAEAALEHLSKTQETFDLFVTDMIMPGMDGPTWVEKAREQGAKAKVLFISGYAAESLKDKQSKVPSASFLAKPFSLQALIQSVQDLLD